MECMFGASRYSVFADAIAHTIWELSPWGARNLQPPPEAAPEVDFELLDMADESEMIDVAQVSDWVETKINSFCQLAEVHAPDFALLHFSTYEMINESTQYPVWSGEPKAIHWTSKCEGTGEHTEQHKPCDQQYAPERGDCYLVVHTFIRNTGSTGSQHGDQCRWTANAFQGLQAL